MGFTPAILASESKAQNACSSGKCKAVPAKMNLQVRVGYDNNFKGKLGSDAKAKAYWQSALVHIQAYYCHSSLGSQIKISTLSVTHYNKKWVASEAGEKTCNAITTANLKGADLMVYMAYDKDQTGPAGIASGGVVCDTTANIQKEKQSISEWFSNTTIFAWTAAHEIGHNLGMDHDFSAKNGGKTGACNKHAGIMSYSDKRTGRWSTCAKNALKVQYNMILNKKMTWCMEAASNFCSTSTTASTTKATTKATTKTTKSTTKATATTTASSTGTACKHKAEVGDCTCDDYNNFAACNYDGGDCCINPKSTKCKTGKKSTHCNGRPPVPPPWWGKRR